MKHQSNYYWLDLIRGISALLVLLSHVRALFFLDYSSTSQNVFIQFFYFITGFGHIAVIIFFVLSGFFIIGSIDKAYINNKWSFRRYGIDRIVRLWVVLIPSLLFTVLCDNFGELYFPESLAYKGELEYLPAVNLNNNQSFAVFFGNMFFIQKILVPTFGTNSPLWSLAYEFWYYCLFPLMYLLIFNWRKSINVLIYLVFILSIFFLIGTDIRNNYLIWLMGGIPYFLSKVIKNNKALSYLTPVIIGMFFVNMSVVRINKLNFLFNDYTLGFVTSLCIFSLINYTMPLNILKRITLFLSNISYTLYLIHMPLAVLITSALIKERLPFTKDNFIIFILISTSIVLFSYVFWLCFEKQTPFIKNLIKSKMLPQAK
ncbi:acyltransferase family protein [Arsenicibacter rosenii]|uniref:Acyltransferase 3 domain-containing protein n=1 Tax=Arsenicibacter rosenii TaxID=1750698 RepID=A0A1S2VK69_9BACT|nr:acyltransferase [Arsenicibacter rosenii]OIN58790.1 hypothetical protein BLX24_11165 [Arsenicibacter rosenii]